jgi:hypothetical protein
MVKEAIMELEQAQPGHPPATRRKDGRAAREPAIEPALKEAPGQLPEALVADLEDKLQQARERLAAITAERKAISLAAHMGSAGDRARLDQLNREGGILAGEIEGIETAIAQVQARIAEAEAAAAFEAEREKRRATLQLADELQGHAEKIDHLWRQSIAEYVMLQAKLHQIAQTCGGRPALHVVQSACRRALVSAFVGTPLQLQLLAPGERHTIANLVATWVQNVRGWTNQFQRRPNGRGTA